MWKLQRKTDLLLEYIKSNLFLGYNYWKKPKLVTIKGICLPVPDDTPSRLKKALYAGYYEKYELKMVASQIQPDDIVMELGTGLGLISSYCAKKIGSERVFTYEANPFLESIIHNTYTLNDVNPRLEIVLLANCSGEQLFYIGKSFWSSSIIQRSPNCQAVKVCTRSFNEEVQRINPSFLVIDIEGGEYELFKYINFHNIKKIAIELHETLIGQEKVKFVKSKLSEAGFHINEKFSFRKKELFWQRN